MCYLKTEINTILTVLLQLSHGIFLKSNVAFLLLQTFELFDKMAKIKTIKTIFMNHSDLLLKTVIITKILLQLSHGNHLKLDIVLSQSFRQNGKVQSY